MDLAKGWLHVLQQWAAYMGYCIEQPLQVPVCRPFWTWVMIAVLAFVAVICLVAIWKVVTYRIKLAAALKAEEARARIDYDAIATRSWDGDKAYSADLGGDEIERRIREAMEQRRAANKLPKPDPD